MTYGVELDQQDLGDLKHEEDANSDQEIPPPEIGNAESIARTDIRWPSDDCVAGHRAEESADLVRTESIPVRDRDV